MTMSSCLDATPLITSFTMLLYQRFAEEVHFPESLVDGAYGQRRLAIYSPQELDRFRALWLK